MRTAVVVDPHSRWLEAVAAALAAADVKVTGTSRSFEQAARLIHELRPDLVVCELATEGGEKPGLSWLGEVSKTFPELKLIVFSDSAVPGEIEAALANGAHVYVVKKADPAELAVAVRQVYDRSLYFERHQAQARPAPRAGPTKEFGLTRRELEILGLTAMGLSNRKIARRLWVTEQTVKFHLSNIYTKLEVSNRTAASRVAQLNELIPTELSGPGDERS